LQYLCDIEQEDLAATRGEDESTPSFKDSRMAKLHDDIDVDTLVIELKLLKNISSSFVPDTFEIETVRDVGKALFFTPSSFLISIFYPIIILKAALTPIWWCNMWTLS